MKALFRLSLILNTLRWLTACGDSATKIPQKEGMVVTFRVAGVEEYRIRLRDPADIEIARKLLAGEDAPHITNGGVRRSAFRCGEGDDHLGSLLSLVCRSDRQRRVINTN